MSGRAPQFDLRFEFNSPRRKPRSPTCPILLGRARKRPSPTMDKALAEKDLIDMKNKRTRRKIAKRK
jgi:hypothetical protein